MLIMTQECDILGKTKQEQMHVEQRGWIQEEDEKEDPAVEQQYQKYEPSSQTKAWQQIQQILEQGTTWKT